MTASAPPVWAPSRGTTRRPPARPHGMPRPIYRSGRVYLATTALLVVAWALVVEVQEVSDFVRGVDDSVVRWIAAHRDPGVAELLATPVVVASSWVWRVLRWSTMAALLLIRRFRHLAVYVAITVAITAVAHVVADLAERAAPVTAWRDVAVGLSTHPSRVIVELGLSAVGVMYTLVPRGRPRNRAKVVTAAAVGSLIAARAYLTAEYPTDLAVAVVLGVAVPVVLYRFLLPDKAFPIRYHDTAPKAFDAETAQDIERALTHQRGWQVHAVDPLRPPGSAGSTPIRVVVSDADRADASPRLVFAKLYSLAHLRSDRWYKVLRAVMYGRLEDEMPFADVRHLVEHEDYMLRVAADGGLPVPRTFGIVEVRRATDYLLLMEWLPDSRQLSAEVVDDDVIDEAFAAVAQMWRMGIAHRDVKPANLVVARGRLHLVDLSFGELVATPWRLAVDLGAMTLCLSLFAAPGRVLAGARRWFTDEELAEALASTRSVTIPAQLRSLLRQRGDDVLARCRALLPPHPMVHVQRWSFARVTLTLTVAGSTIAVAMLAAYNAARSGLL